MCLETKQVKAEIAKKNIVCYKILSKHVGEKGVEYYSPIYYHFWFANKPNKDIHFASSPYWVKGEDKKETFNRDTKETCYEVCSGYFHTYKNKEDAMRTVSTSWGEYKYVVVRCIIPKGTRYYEGDFRYYEGGFGYCECYASQYLKITKIIAEK